MNLKRESVYDYISMIKYAMIILIASFADYGVAQDRRKKMKYKSYKKGGKYRSVKLKKNG